MKTPAESFATIPYSLRPIRSTFFGRTEFGIFFEESQVRSTTLPFEEVKDLVFLLNTAWNLGFMSGEVRAANSQWLTTKQVAKSK